MSDLERFYEVFLRLLDSIEENEKPRETKKHLFSLEEETAHNVAIETLRKEAFLFYLLWFEEYMNLRKHRFTKLPDDEEIEYYSPGDFFLEQPLELSYPPKPLLDRS